MRKFILFILKISFVIIIAFVSYNYFTINQDGKIDNVNHFEEIGKGTGEAINNIKKVYPAIKNSKQLEDFKNGYKSKRDTI